MFITFTPFWLLAYTGCILSIGLGVGIWLREIAGPKSEPETKEKP